MERMNGHLSDIRIGKDTTVARHFAAHGTILNPQFTVTVLEFINHNKNVVETTILRKLKEKQWIARCDTRVPKGLNLDE